MVADGWRHLPPLQPVGGIRDVLARVGVADGCRRNAYLPPYLQPRNVHVANGLRGYFGGGCRVADKNENNVFCTCDSMGDIKRRLLVMVV